MAMPTVEYTAVRTLQEVLYRRLMDAQGGDGYHPQWISWHDVGRALDEALDALEAQGYVVAKR